MYENAIICTECGAVIESGEAVDIHGLPVCKECAERLGYVLCDKCGEYHRRSEMVSVRWNDGTTELWCRMCRICSAVTCTVCGEIIPESEAHYFDGEYYCENCKDLAGTIRGWRAPRGVNQYSYKPAPIFCPVPSEDSIFYGYELEMETGDNDPDEVADFINENLGYTYAKKDCSIGEDGDYALELVSHPATLEYHMSKKSAYAELFKSLIRDGARSHDPGTCGLHVHISLEQMEKKNPFAVHNLLIIFDKFWKELVRFSRRDPRDPDQMHWCSRYSTNGIIYERLKDNSKYNCDRYTAVNLQNTHTVEIRLFRGTLNIETFFATLQLVDTIVNKAIEIGSDLSEMEKLTWDDLVKSNHAELNAYLEKRGLVHVEASPFVMPSKGECIQRLSVGTRVVTNNNWHSTSSLIRPCYAGTIIDTVDEGEYVVAFDNYCCGHNANTREQRNDCLYVHYSEIDVVA